MHPTRNSAALFLNALGAWLIAVVMLLRLLPRRYERASRNWARVKLRVEVKLRDKTKLKGYTGEANADYFTVVDGAAGLIESLTRRSDGSKAITFQRPPESP